MKILTIERLRGALDMKLGFFRLIMYLLLYGMVDNILSKILNSRFDQCNGFIVF